VHIKTRTESLRRCVFFIWEICTPLEQIYSLLYSEAREGIAYISAVYSRDSSAGTATGYGLDYRGVGVQVPVGVRIFTSPCLPDRLWDPPKLLYNVYRGLVPRGVKRLGRDADHSPPTNAEVKKMWIYTSTPTYSFMA
jgi:hypothetical protein